MEPKDSASDDHSEKKKNLVSGKYKLGRNRKQGIDVWIGWKVSSKSTQCACFLCRTSTGSWGIHQPFAVLESSLRNTHSLCSDKSFLFNGREKPRSLKRAYCTYFQIQQTLFFTFSHFIFTMIPWNDKQLFTPLCRQSSCQEQICGLQTALPVSMSVC